MRFAFLLVACLTGLLEAADLRLGIIGTDTSHVPAFTQALNDSQSPEHVPGARIVMAYRGGSPDIEESSSRIDKFTSEIVNQYRVKLVPAIAQMCPDVDGLLLESVDGRAHLNQFREAARCHKPIFVDKPLAASREDAVEIARIGRETKIPWFSASTLRYSPVADLSKTSIAAAFVWAPGPNEPHQPLALTWYGIHGVEMLYTILGAGCQAVSQLTSADSDTLTGIWNDGRQGTIHLQRPYGKYGAVVFHRDKSVETKLDVEVSYLPLVKQIVAFMQTKTPPVANDVTLEMFAFMDAAQRSQAARGTLTPLQQ